MVYFSLFCKLKLPGVFSTDLKFGIEVWKSWKRTQVSLKSKHFFVVVLNNQPIKIAWLLSNT